MAVYFIMLWMIKIEFWFIVLCSSLLKERVNRTNAKVRAIVWHFLLTFSLMMSTLHADTPLQELAGDGIQDDSAPLQAMVDSGDAVIRLKRGVYSRASFRH
jgi:hypothetical protein